MSKRSRDGGVLVSRPLVGVKRSAEFEDEDTPKRQRRRPSLKRSADFDCAVDHLHKRLKATTPTAEQAMAFLLPHLLTLRTMYLEVCQANATLTAHNSSITAAYSELRDTSTAEIGQLRRDLDLATYRVSLMQRPHCR